MNDRGHAAVELAMAVGVLLFPVALVVTAFGPWSERRVLAESSAAEAARMAVLQLDHEAGAEVVARAGSEYGLDQSSLRLGWCGAAPASLPAGAGTCPMVRGGVVQATVQVWAPLIVTPWGEVGGLWVTASHSEPVDLYRSLG